MSDEKDKSTSKPRAADDVDSIRARLAELQKEREEAQKKANEKEAEVAQTDNSASCLSNLSIGDVVHVLGLGTVPCVIADFPTKDTALVILHDGLGQLRKLTILRGTITRKVTN